jgi:aquaporin Z
MPADNPKAAPRRAARQLAAEVFGTFALTLTACAVEILAAAHPEISHGQRAAASALTVVAMVYAVSDVSGAHINPAVTFAFALRGAFDWRRLPGYWLAQLVGAVAGAGVARALVGSAGVVTFLLVSVIIHTSQRRGTVGPHAALAVGGAITACGIWGGPLTGAAMNPARSFGPALLGLHFHGWWIYALGPALGALGAAIIAFAVHGPPTEDERQAAEGQT